MKLHDRCVVEGTNPLIYIGHREFKDKKTGKMTVARSWHAEWNHDGKKYDESLKTTNKRSRPDRTTAADFWAFNVQMAKDGLADGTIEDRLVIIKQAFKWATMKAKPPLLTVIGVGVVAGSYVWIGDHVTIGDGVVLGHGVFLGDGVVLEQGVKIEDDVILRQNAPENR